MATPPPVPSHRDARATRRRRPWLLVLAGVAVAAAAFGAWRAWLAAAKPRDVVAVFAAERGPLTINVTISGAIQNRDLVIVKSELEGRATLLRLMQEGTTVEKGDLLAELDSSKLVDDRTQQTITVMNAEAGHIRAQESLAMTKSQSESDIRGARLDCTFAKMDLEKYEKGDFPQEERQGLADITIADEELKRANEQLEWSRKLADEKFITRTELQADNLTAKRCGLSLSLAQARLRLLRDYTYNRRTEELSSNVTQTAAALDRVIRKGRGDTVQAEADLKAKESEFNRQRGRLDKLDDQIRKCRIFAPVAGMVVYATTGKSSFRGNVEPLAEGQEIRERQELIFLPTTASMMAQVKIHESSLRKVQKGQPVRVTVDAAPGKTFSGRVGKIALLPDAQSMWMNPDVKVYDTEIWIDGDARELRAGMTCKAEVIVATYPLAVYVPIQTVVRVMGQPTVYLNGPSGAVPRSVEIGLDNNRMVHVVSGLQAGERVLLAPPLGPSAAPYATEPPVTPASTPAGPPAAIPVPTPGGGTPASPAARTDTGGTKGPEPAGTTTAPTDTPNLRTMSPEERRRYFESLTPAQQEEMRRKMGSRRPKRDAPDGIGTTPAPEGP